MTKALLIIALAAALSGCFNIRCHVARGNQYAPYESTKSVCCGIVEAFVEKPEWHGGSLGEARMSSAFSTILLPFWLVALPLEAVADTVTFPYDVWEKK